MDGKVTKPEFIELINNCESGSRTAQKKLYLDYYGFAMSVCLRYCKTKEEAQEVINNSFLKVFLNLKKYNVSQSFKNWFKRILINASIDFYRSQQRHYYHQNIDTAFTIGSDLQNAEGNLAEADLMQIVHSLPLAYKTSFCLYALDGFSHKEIANQLGIGIGTSKSNVSRARKLLRHKLMSVSEDTQNIKVE